MRADNEKRGIIWESLVHSMVEDRRLQLFNVKLNDYDATSQTILQLTLAYLSKVTNNISFLMINLFILKV